MHLLFVLIKIDSRFIVCMKSEFILYAAHIMILTNYELIPPHCAVWYLNFYIPLPSPPPHEMSAPRTVHIHFPQKESFNAHETMKTSTTHKSKAGMNLKTLKLPPLEIKPRQMLLIMNIPC